MKYSVGDTIELIKMENDANPIQVGTRGIIKKINSMPDNETQIEVNWENGRNLSLIYPEDQFKVIYSQELGIDFEKIKVDRVVMSGSGPRYTYRLMLDGNVLFKTSTGSYLAWSKKRDAQAIIVALKLKGIEYVEEKLEQKMFINFHNNKTKKILPLYKKLLNFSIESA